MPETPDVIILPPPEEADDKPVDAAADQLFCRVCGTDRSTLKPEEPCPVDGTRLIDAP